MEGPQPELSGHGSSRRRAMGQLGSREDRSMTRYERQKLRQRLTFHGSQFERGDGSSLDALLRALDLIVQVEGERDIYRRALERIAGTGCRDIERAHSRLDAIAVDAWVEGGALREKEND